MYHNMYMGHSECTPCDSSFIEASAFKITTAIGWMIVLRAFNEEACRHTICWGESRDNQLSPP